MNKVIVFGVNIQNTLGLIRSIGEKGIPVILLLEPCMKGTCYVKYSRYIKTIHYLKSTEEGLDVLRQLYWNEYEKPVILCGGDASVCLLDAHYEELKKHFFIFNAGSENRINYFEDKWHQFEIAKKCGITLISTWNVKDPSCIPDDISYPCLVKGNNSIKSTKGDMFVCCTRQELQGSLKTGVDYLLQEYIEKDFELNINGISFDHGNNVYMPAGIYKIRDDLYKQGLFMRLDPIDSFHGLPIESIKKFIKELSYEGIFSIEFLCKGGKYYFLEINMRNDGLGYMYTAAGANYPYLWVKYLRGELEDKDTQKRNVRTPFFVMHENDMYNVLNGKVSIWQWMKDFRRCGAFFIMNARDPMPFVMSTCIHFRQACKMVVRKVFKINIR